MSTISTAEMLPLHSQLLLRLVCEELFVKSNIPCLKIILLLLKTQVWRNVPVLLYILNILFPICILVHYILVYDILIQYSLVYDILVHLGIIELLVPLCFLDIVIPDILSSPWYLRASSSSLYLIYARFVKCSSMKLS